MTGSAKSPSDVMTRSMTAIALIPLVVLVFMGGPLAMVIGLVVGGIMALEVVAVSQNKFASPRGLAIVAVTVIPSAIYAFGGGLAVSPDAIVLAALVLALMLVHGVISRLMLAFLVACIYSLMGILMMDSGVTWLMLTVSAVGSADSFAYFGGRRFGGAKLAPMISPSKTWSGAICGVIGGGVVAAVLGPQLGIALGPAVMMGLVIADLSIGSDLLESWV
ncbi:MAG: phosphatidate cytidylyltransferase [Alphaproteobacteria bacterium]|nr:phosphatidate cytidylyltransferase [Alphaproteobacteria bacterium]